MAGSFSFVRVKDHRLLVENCWIVYWSDDNLVSPLHLSHSHSDGSDGLNVLKPRLPEQSNSNQRHQAKRKYLSSVLGFMSPDLSS